MYHKVTYKAIQIPQLTKLQFFYQEVSVLMRTAYKPLTIKAVWWCSASRDRVLNHMMSKLLSNL